MPTTGNWRFLEVKNTEQVRPSDLRGLRAFGEDYPEATRWLIYHEKERPLRDGVIPLLGINWHFKCKIISLGHANTTTDFGPARSERRN